MDERTKEALMLAASVIAEAQEALIGRDDVCCVDGVDQMQVAREAIAAVLTPPTALPDVAAEVEG